MPGGKGKIRPEDNPKPFKKGVDNGGRYPTGTPNTKTRLKRLLSLLQDVKNPLTNEMDELSIAEQLDAAMVLKALGGDVFAYQEIINRVDGKQGVTQEGGDEDKGNDNEFKLTIVRPEED